MNGRTVVVHDDGLHAETLEQPEPVPDRILAPYAPFGDRKDLRKTVLRHNFPHLPDLVFSDNQDDRVDFRAILKMLDGPGDNRLSVKVEKLLGTTGAHTDPPPRRRNHNANSPVLQHGSGSQMMSIASP